MASNDAIKRFAVTVDLKNTLPLAPFEVVQGDTGNVIAVSVTNGGEPVDISDCCVTAVFSSTAGTSFQDREDGSITVSGSTAEITLLPTAIGPGQVSCELQIFASTLDAPTGREDYDLLVTSARFCFRCRKPMLNEDSLEAIPQAPLLTALLGEAEEAEADRAAAEILRVQAEAARARAEAARALAESMRAASELARESAEAARAEEFAALIASVGYGSITGSSAPNSGTQAQPGQFYLDTTNRQAYVCTGIREGQRLWRAVQMGDGAANSLTVERSSTYVFSQLPNGEPMSLQELVNRLAGWYTEIDSKQDALTFDDAPTQNSAAPVKSGGVYEAVHYADWAALYDSTLQSDASIINITRRDNSHGGGEFACDELRLVLIGAMSGGTSARVYVNSVTSSFMVFNQFGIADPDEPQNCASVLMLSKPVEGVVCAQRTFGGDQEGTGRSQSYASHSAALVLPGVTKYTALRLTGDSASVRFPAGTRVILQGRNTR